MIDYSAKIIADSINPVGNRITTFELTYPRFVHAELMTHRMFSRNSASSRAIPVEKLVERIRQYPVMPKFWGSNQAGMQAGAELEGDALLNAQLIWLDGSRQALALAERLADAGLHKQIANRVIEPWMFITVIVTATTFENWFGRRDHKDAQPEIAWVAREMRKLYEENRPAQLRPGEWHLPYVELWDKESPLYISPSCTEFGYGFLRRISTARCARVSYLTHDGVRDLHKDIELHDKLTTNGHWSPFEHPAECLDRPERWGNFTGWKQYRKTFKHESGETR
jgi:hypothetical protein